MIDLFINVIAPSLIASFGWGLSPYFDKRALEYIDSNTLLIFRNLLVGVLSIIVLVFFRNKIKLDTKIKKSFKFVLCSAISSVMIGSFFYYKALSKTKSTTLVVLISYVMPLIFITLISNYFLKEKINLGMISGLILVIIGIIVFIYNSK
jgi:uncharacterized membrane protein